MKQLIIAIAAMMPLMAQAAELNDTTLTVGNDSIVIGQADGKTTVQVYNRQGGEMKKAREVEFIDGQEIERVYVTSPFIPQSLGKKKGRRELKAHYPLFYMGFSQIPGSVMGMGGGNGLPTRNSKSWEWGVALMSVAFALNNSTAITSAIGYTFFRNHFESNNILTNTDGTVTIRPEEEAKVEKSYLKYSSMRLPVMVEWQQRKGRRDLYAAAGVSMEMRFEGRSRYKINDKTRTETDELNINPVGFNLEFFAGYGFLMVYGRASLTPLFKKSRSPECYPMAIGLGIRI